MLPKMSSNYKRIKCRPLCFGFRHPPPHPAIFRQTLTNISVRSIVIRVTRWHPRITHPPPPPVIPVHRTYYIPSSLPQPPPTCRKSPPSSPPPPCFPHIIHNTYELAGDTRRVFYTMSARTLRSRTVHTERTHVRRCPSTRTCSGVTSSSLTYTHTRMHPLPCLCVGVAWRVNNTGRPGPHTNPFTRHRHARTALSAAGIC